MFMTKDEKAINIEYFKNLLEPIYNELYKYIYCIVKDNSIADDVLQNTLISGYTYLYQLKNEDKFKYWMFKIAKREAIDYIKKNKIELSIDALDTLSTNTSVLIEDIIVHKEIKKGILDIINNLDSTDRNFIILHYYCDFTLKEISKLTGTNQNTLKTKHRRIKKILYDSIKSKNLL